MKVCEGIAGEEGFWDDFIHHVNCVQQRMLALLTWLSKNKQQRGWWRRRMLTLIIVKKRSQSASVCPMDGPPGPAHQCFLCWSIRPLFYDESKSTETYLCCDNNLTVGSLELSPLIVYSCVCEMMKQEGQHWLFIIYLAFRFYCNFFESHLN